LRVVDVLAANAAVLLGAILQASTGLGAGLIIVPLLALVSLDFVPGPVVLASVALSGIMAVQGRREIQTSGLGLLSLFLCLGVVIGALSISAIPPQRAGIAFGALVLVAVAISVAMPDMQRNAPVVVAGGTFAGFMAAISGIGAPVLALLYQNEPPRVLRATLGMVFTISSTAILACLHFVGRFGAHEAWLGLLITPGYVLGFFVAIPMARRLNSGSSRKAVLVISTLSAVMLIVRSLYAH
jgi:uncharacterized membrane protein YfcA